MMMMMMMKMKKKKMMMMKMKKKKMMMMMMKMMKMMMAHDGTWWHIVFLQVFVFLGNEIVNLETYLCLIVFSDQKAALSEGSAMVVCCGHLYIDFGQGQGPSERPSGAKHILLGRDYSTIRYFSQILYNCWEKGWHRGW